MIAVPVIAVPMIAAPMIAAPMTAGAKRSSGMLARRLMRAGAAPALVLGVVLAACSSGTAAVIAAGQVHTDITATASTPEPTVVPTPTAAPTPRATAIPIVGAPTAIPTPEPTVIAETPTPEPSPTPVMPPTVTVVPTVAPADAPTATPGPSPTPIVRVVENRAAAPFATLNGLAIVAPAARIERIGFHEAGHPGSQQMEVVESGLRWLVLDSRGRGTGSRTAADIVVEPGVPILAPVTGEVFAANTYTLYCEHEDALVYIRPDDLPGWQLKMFHIEGLQVSVGDRVTAGHTVLASSARTLPFVSQVDEFTAEPSWPHVHIEVINPDIPDERPAGRGCPE